VLPLVNKSLPFTKYYRLRIYWRNNDETNEILVPLSGVSSIGPVTMNWFECRFGIREKEEDAYTEAGFILARLTITKALKKY
jgi:hypothetical protein